MHRRVLSPATAAALLLVAGVALVSQETAPISVWVDREYNSWDNALHTEFSINEKTVSIFTSDTVEPISEHLKPGWNTFVLKTTPQEPATRNNELILRFGPAHKQQNKILIAPVLWELRNGTDWAFDAKTGTYSHPLGPGVKDVTLSYQLYYAGLERERGELKAGDYVLSGKATYQSWSSPVVAAVWINGTPLNSFTLAARQIIITDLLKPGKNEIKLVSSRVRNVIRDNDIEFAVGGPAEWNVTRKQYVLTPIVQFKAMQGWKQDPKTGQRINPMKPDADTIERVIPFVLKSPPAGGDSPRN